MVLGLGSPSPTFVSSRTLFQSTEIIKQIYFILWHLQRGLFKKIYILWEYGYCFKKPQETHLRPHVTISLTAQSIKNWTFLSFEGDFTFIVSILTFLDYSTYSIWMILQNTTIQNTCKAWMNRYNRCHLKQASPIRNCQTGYLLETNIIKIHTIFITKPLRSCMHHPWDSSIWNKATGKNHRPGNH